MSNVDIYLSGKDPRFCKRGIGQYPARLSGGFQSPTEINASGGLQTCAVEGAYAPRTSRQERRGVLEFSQAIAKVCASWELYEHSNGFRARNF